MSLLFSTEIMAAVREELKSAKESVQIISAYCKVNALRELSQFIEDDISSKKIMLRFRLDDIIKGSTDFEVLDFCISSGWDVFIRFDLHAKTYIIDNKRGIVGSANTTLSGLGIGKSINYEMASLVELEQHDLPKISRVFADALYVDLTLYNKLKQQIRVIDCKEVGQTYRWSNEIEYMYRPRIDILFSHEFPESISLENEENDYISFLDIPRTVDGRQIKEAFRWCNAYLWLLSVLADNNGELYFGTLSYMLHDSLVEDPKPYRKKVKELLSNLLGWIDELKMDEVTIDRPNYSQRVRLVV